jgi:hypothetical protein
MPFWGNVRKSLIIPRKRSITFLLSLLILLSPLYADKIRCKWSGVEKIVAVADIHGNYDNFVKILKGTNLVDENLDWIGEKIHLVQLGDILDRGDGAKDAFDLLMKLEKQAEAVGGMVHVLIGNHEEVNIVGIALQTSGYVTKKQLLDFLPVKYKEKREAPIREKFAAAGDSDGALENEIDKFWKKELNNAGKNPSKLTESEVQYQKYFFNNYGKWLLTKNLAIKINETIFVHGGFSDNNYYLDMDLQELNDSARREFRAFANAIIYNYPNVPQPKFLLQARAPHWYRDWVREPEDGNSNTLTQVLAKLKARYMVVGHTVRPVEIVLSKKLDRFDERIWAIDVGISDFFKKHTKLCALLYERVKVNNKDAVKFTYWWGDDEK